MGYSSRNRMKYYKRSRNALAWKRMGLVFSIARKKKGLKGFQLARKLGYAPSVWSRIETGVNPCPTAILKKLGKILKLDADEVATAYQEDKMGLIVRDAEELRAILAEAWEQP